MTKGRIEAFSDGVLAIILTIMVLELRPPQVNELSRLLPMVPTFLSYALSFVFIAIYWNNHHHLFQVVEQVRGSALWANMHLLFWLSLVPFVTAWMGSNHFAAQPVFAYGLVLTGCAISYGILVKVLVSHHGPDSRLRRAIRGDMKGNLSVLLYVAALPLAFVERYVSCGLYVLVAIIWLIPDRRIEEIVK